MFLICDLRRKDRRAKRDLVRVNPERVLLDFAQNVGRSESVDNEVFAFNPK